MSAHVEVLVDGAHTGGACAVASVRAPRGTVLPPHAPAHARTTLAVLEGCVEVALPEGPRRLGPGDRIELAAQTFRSISVVQDARVLAVVTPAGMERLAIALAPPVPEPDDVAALLAAAGIRLLPGRAA